MDTENQASLAFEENIADNGIEYATEAADPSSTEPSTNSSATADKIERNDPSYFLARDIQLDANLHERRAFSEDDLAFADAVTSQSHLVAPFPVVRRGNSLFLVDGYVHLGAIVEGDRDALVKVIEVSEEDALAIRFADTRRARGREPMVSSRQALARHRSGVAQEAIAKELGVSAGNVSQMISAAQTEEELGAVADRLVNRSKVSRGWWFDVHTTRERLKKADGAEPEGSTPNMDRFRRAIEKLLESGGALSTEQVREALNINVKRAEPKRRNRMLGKPEKRRGLKVRLNVDRKRQGGKVINFPPGFPDEEFEAALEALLAFLMPPGSDAGPASKN
ncbi:hypothetical protein QQS45_06525 [Alteriqipengyuania flavescens]|uniref:hypothetical protein n=1 Tax=Alteriqipengyuania flavescens TaxID=3053610 RepID=UPI0025B497FA|nr:hypothetical protein [Alteriqipengyuania flavescens]WJY19864.1 hypothetical protein QQW98_06520 [Alteriqipengyuania flavescens]WJY25806.1 hypothetical protein QQS45_06525 [Alteriqipengyuania flavescens]